MLLLNKAKKKEHYRKEKRARVCVLILFFCVGGISFIFKVTFTSNIY